LQKSSPWLPLVRKRAGGNFFASIVNWITFVRVFPGQSTVHRMAEADFNIRGWQGRWRYTASTALFFLAL
jgi:hypothetical protein